MIADHHANLERVGKIETLPILQICPCPSQVGDIYVFISRQNLGQSGNSKNPDRLRLSRHMKIRLNISNRVTWDNREIIWKEAKYIFSDAFMDVAIVDRKVH